MSGSRAAGTPACPGPHDGRRGGHDRRLRTSSARPVRALAPGEYGELLRAIRAGATYANVHSSKYTGGEIRAQIERGHATVSRSPGSGSYGIWTPEIARAITSRWISEVPSKIV